jgi:hypothetical protein
MKFQIRKVSKKISKHFKQNITILDFEIKFVFLYLKFKEIL